MTFVEVLVAIVILSIALLVFVDIAGTVGRANKKSDLYATATRYANSQLELVLAKGPSQLTDGVVTTTISELPNGAMVVTTGAPTGVASSTDIKEVDVAITWSTVGSSAPIGGSLKMSTMVALLK